MKAHSLASSLVLGALLASSAVADGRKPGSVLVYPVHRSDIACTLISVTNTALRPATPTSLGDGTNVHFHYVNVTLNPANRLRPTDCTVFDRVEYLTPADTLSVLAHCHNAGGSANRGYLVVSAEDPQQSFVPWAHDALVGSALVAIVSGVVYTYEAFSLKAEVADGSPTDVLPANGQLDFNGSEYEELPDHLIVDNFIAVFSQSLALVNLTGRHEDVNTVYLAIWNDNEFPLSLTLSFNCWFHERLQDISTLFTEGFMHGLPNDMGEVDIACTGWGEFETGWFKVQSTGVRTRFGNRVSSDGAILGLLTAGPALGGGARLLWECGTQSNGNFGPTGPIAPVN